MASSRDRQRALARAKAERQLARRAATARRRRRIQAGTTGGLALAVLVLGAMWVGGVFEPPPPKPADCVWVSRTDDTNQNIKDVGTPPTHDIPKSGTKTMTIKTNQGTITAQLDLKHSPCAAASFTYLASKHFFDDTKCHKLIDSTGVYVLGCGDPSGTDTGGPSYTFSSENLPPPSPAPTPETSGSAAPETSGSAAPSAEPSPADPAVTNPYPRGTLALFANEANANGSQFYIVYKDSPDLGRQFSIFGHVTEGLDVVDKIAAGGVQDIGGQEALGGTPKIDVVVQSLTVGPQQPASPMPSSTPPPASTSAGSSTSGSAKP